VRYGIEVLDTGERFTCSGGEYVLEAMTCARCGPLHYGCFGGGCGICKMKIVSGSYSTEKRMSRAHVSELEESEGVVLICCIKPLGDLKIARLSPTCG